MIDSKLSQSNNKKRLAPVGPKAEEKRLDISRGIGIECKTIVRKIENKN